MCAQIVNQRELTCANEKMIKVIKITLSLLLVIEIQPSDTKGCEEIHSVLLADANANAYAQLKRKGINLNQKCSLFNGETAIYNGPPIFYAISESPADHIALLIKAGANPNIRNDEGLTPLMFAAEHHNPEISVSILLKNGANPRLKDNNGLTFFSHFRADDSEIRLKFVSPKLKPSGEDDFAYLIKVRTANLSPEAKSAALERIKTTLSQAKKQTISYEGLSPVEWAVRHSDKELLDILVAAGLSCKFKTLEVEHSDLLLEGLKLAGSNIESAKCLTGEYRALNIADDHGRTILMRALELGTPASTIDLLIQNGANINAKDKTGATPLMYAASGAYNGDIGSQQSSVIRKLIEVGANIHALDNTGYNAVMYAADVWGRDHTDRISALEEAGAKLDVRAPNYCSASDLAWLNTNNDTLNYLRKKGHDVTGSSVLMCAIGSGKLDHQVEAAIRQTRNGNASDGEGRTALIFAAQKCQYGWVKALIAAGASKYEKDKSGNTALQYLKECNEYTDQRVLHGGKININELRGLLSY